ncbi:MAG: hypothetical protein H6528_02345 [Actinobacteria bacterium]|nr:hypothetical protein [Actinomycetota bacterium]MCB8996125.1 hypothetical protein [Actinomycetota bacterium]HRY10120.1 hypothetical protein [Candidatus Nanopelagicales bacterium]
MPIRDDLRAALTEAMRRRDTAVIPQLRSVIAAIDNGEAVAAVPLSNEDSPIAGSVSGLGTAEVPRIELSEQEQVAIFTAEMAELAHHVDRLTTLCRRDEADAARRALSILGGVLDAQASTKMSISSSSSEQER